MTYEVLGTGSTGNAVILNGSVLIDCGLPWKRIQPRAKDLRLVLLTHEHGDHFKLPAVRALAKERPGLRWGCCAWMVGHLLAADVPAGRIDVYEHGQGYRYEGLAEIRPEQLLHDVPNCGYHICMAGEWAFYATDTSSLAGITAAGYALYLIESNYTETEMQERLKEKLEAGQFAYERRVIQTHLSREQAEAWLYSQMGPHSRYCFLHQHQERK